MTNEIILQAMSVKELEGLLHKLIHEEFETINVELQRVIGEDDLVSIGTACRILGVCSKSMKVLTDAGYFTVFHHLKERRYIRGELLAYRNGYRVNRKRR
ncbi:MAG: hypothetical protein ACKV1O_16125 [Saprospiraceae bacterium]